MPLPVYRLVISTHDAGNMYLIADDSSVRNTRLQSVPTHTQRLVYTSGLAFAEAYATRLVTIQLEAVCCVPDSSSCLILRRHHLVQTFVLTLLPLTLQEKAD
jgi:hypothetical protein